MPVRILPEPLPARIAIIGGGVAGLACARRLIAAGARPRVYERTRAPGGRCATRETEVGPFDHGVLDLVAYHPDFFGQLSFWVENGMATDWLARVVQQAPDGSTLPGPGRRYVGIPTMQSIGLDLARGVDLAVGCSARRVIRDVHGRWFIELRDARGERTDGPYDMMLIAVAADQAVPLLAEAPQLRAVAESVRSLPVWTLLAAYAAPIDAPFDVAWPDHPQIACMARDSSKPGRPPGERWVVHAAPDWSLVHVDDDPVAVRGTLLAAFERLVRAPATPSYVAMHRWRYGIAMHPVAQPFLWDDALQLGACGDWLGQAHVEPGGAGTVESAWLGGDALGRRAAHALLGRTLA